MANKENLLLLYHRPLEPSFVAKGKRSAAFVVPYSYLPDRYKPIGTQLADKYGDEANETIPVREISLPELGEILDLGRQENFSLFLPKHQYLAGLLIDLFLAMRNVDEVQSLAIYARERVNPYLFNYAFSVAILHRADTGNLNVPALIFSFPDKFIDSQVFVQVREEAFMVAEVESRIPIEIPVNYTASDLEPEHRLWYFREDLAVNHHHWHWHLAYPYTATLAVVNKNRRGELFYYMHQQIIARYNAERFCNQLPRVKRFIDWRDPIKEAYFSKLNSTVASRGWPHRVHDQKLKNLNREADQMRQDVDDIIYWRDRIIAAIQSGFYIDTNGNKIPFTEYEGIDVLANMVESSILSPNPTFYGNLHNMGHIFIACVHDPDGRFLEPTAVMSDTTTAMRDPLFYRWHSYLDYVFHIHKDTLPRYQINQLNYDGITITDVVIKSTNSPDDQLNTFWQKSDLDLSGGLDFASTGSVYIRFTHLQHKDFNYNITVNNIGLPRMGTCRIFIAPTYNEKGSAWSFIDQKNLFIALDRFTVHLSTGQNIITRKSTESTVTIPWEQTFRNPDSYQGTDAVDLYNFCGCGWPHHMLIPKGTPTGFACQLFVMISNYADDQILQDTSGPCNTADNYCGIRDQLYPDRRSMGYPFDRLPRTGVTTLQDFLTSNMFVQNVTIHFTDRIMKPKGS